MQDKHRKQRQAKRAQRNKRKRANASRPGVGGPIARVSAGGSVAKGRTWPVGECYVSEGYDEPGASVDLVFSRSRPEGSAVIATFAIDRSGAGLRSARAIGGVRKEHVAGECGNLSERSGRAMVGCAPGLVAALVDDAIANGEGGEDAAADALSLLEGVERLELPVPFGPEQAEEDDGAKGKGWFGWLGGR